MKKTSYADRMTYRVTRALHRLYPGLPVLKAWPGTAYLRAGAHRRLIRPVANATMWRWAVLHRAGLEDTTFIGVTGSAGKTMTKCLIGSVLSTTFRGRFRPGTHNTDRGTARSVLGDARSGDEYHVVELSGHEPGALERQLRLVRPRIGVVTNVGTDHYKAFGSIDAIAVEKGRLVRSLPENGVAILNADDPRVLAMRDGCRARVITFGLSPDAMVRAEAVSAAWPERLSFSVVYEGAAVQVQTQLCGTQWVTAALAAIATGVASGVPLEAAALALERVEPYRGRMNPVVLPDGTTFIRDDWKAPVHTIPPSLDFLRTACAKRKIAILGTISDTMGDAGKVYVDTARHALEAAETVCFVGPRAFAAMRAAPTDRPERLRAFATMKAANDFLSGFLQPGDLILLKGSNQSEHLYRLALSRTTPVACWRMDCNRKMFCNRCELLTTPSSSTAPEAPPEPEMDAAEYADQSLIPGFEGTTGASVLIGLGNPGEAYQDTPHNVGYEVLECLAKALNAEWRTDREAAIATVEWQGQRVWLVKPNVFMNQSGPALHRLSQRVGFRPDHCILIYDDLDLPLGAVRTRMRGSDGGHRGVRSVLEAFQTDQFRRVKIGVKRAGEAVGARDAVLKPFAPEERTLVHAALVQARERISALVLPRPPLASARGMSSQTAVRR